MQFTKLEKAKQINKVKKKKKEFGIAENVWKQNIKNYTSQI
jgi:hypothetical protein